LAVQISKHLGASSVIAAGRDRERLKLLPSLGADAVVQLGGDSDTVSANVGAAAAEVDVVLDYIWGQPALDSIFGIVKERSDRGRRLTWIQIGAQAGATIQLPSALVRQADLCIMGSGQGSIGVAGMLEELPRLAAALSDGTIDLRVESVPLSQVGRVWEEPMSADERLVFTP
jgi:NADPH:quinone reductase-like Zn-dependent oxidoreductase